MDKLEQSVLGEFINLPTYQEQVDIMLDLGIKYFSDSNAISLFQLFGKILIERRSHIDFTTVYSDVTKIEGFEIQDFIDIATTYSADGKIKVYIELLKERKYKRDLYKLISNSLEKIDKSISLDEIETHKDTMLLEINKIGFEDKSEFINPTEYIAKIEGNLDKKNPLEGHSWGLTYLDTATSGIVSPRLYVIGGLKKTGKTRFVINTMYNLYKQKIPSVFLSLEMPAYEVTKLFISRYTQIPEPHLRGLGIISNEERRLFNEAKNDIDWRYINVECANRLNNAQIITRIRRYAKLFDNPVIFIDYLQRVEHDRNKQAQELEKIAVSIADATREYNVPIILLSQLSNIAEREGVSIGSLKGSGGIGESADAIILLDNLFRGSQDPENENKMKVIIEQRYGDSAKFDIATDLKSCIFADEPARFNK